MDGQVPVTVHSRGPDAYAYLSGPPLIGFGLRWLGHNDRDGTIDSQPRWWWWPTGAFAWYQFRETSPRYELVGNESSVIDRATSDLAFGTTYTFKAQVTDGATGTSYRFKSWPQGTPEPAQWTTEIDGVAGPSAGSVILLAHHVDATFGNPIVRPVPGGSG